MVPDLSRSPAVVLVVEDEMTLRMRAVDMVEDAGYTPVEALDADEAVAILESRSDIALLCTDIQLPGSMDGLGLARSVHKRWPAIKIILVSGQLNPPSIDLPPCSRFFGKPLQAWQIIAQLRSMIGHARSLVVLAPVLLESLNANGPPKIGAVPNPGGYGYKCSKSISAQASTQTIQNRTKTSWRQR
jgi:CheY-like chemotaxis protein